MSVHRATPVVAFGSQVNVQVACEVGCERKIADPIDNQRAGVHVYPRQMVQALIKHDSSNEYILIRETIIREAEKQGNLHKENISRILHIFRWGWAAPLKI